MSSQSMKSVLITGANAGIGKEVARQLAAIPGVEWIHLACRDDERALTAKRELETSTGRKVFKIVLMDVSSVASVRHAIAGLHAPLDAVILNAGGTGGKTPMALTEDGVTNLFAQNVLGHVVLLEGLLREGRLTKAAVFLGSEGARGVPRMGIKRPTTKTLEGFRDLITGKAYQGQKVDIFSAYGAAKYVGALWMSSLARQYPQIRLITISPGGTKGTNAARSMPTPMRLFAKFIFAPVIAPLLGLMHPLETGARRIVEGLFDQSLLSGRFYASAEKVLTGPLVDQGELFPNFSDTALQDKAAAAIREFTA